MEHTPKVNIVLATYNGEKHVKNQIDSILAQDYANFHLYIRDDGSKDHTVKILKDYETADPRVHVLETKENLGVPDSFYEILRQCDDGDYYAFADQDDVWEPFKIRRAVEALEKEDGGLPLMYCSSFAYYEGEDTYIRDFDLTSEVNLYNSIYFTPALGFTLVFNETLRKMALRNTMGIKKDEWGELHDRRFLRVAALFGKVICDPCVSAKHIRHMDAVTSADSDNMGLLGGWLKNELFGRDLLIQQVGIQKFINDFKEELQENDLKVLEFFAHTGHGWKKVFYPHRLRQRWSGEILLRILFFFHKA